MRVLLEFDFVFDNVSARIACLYLLKCGGRLQTGAEVANAEAEVWLGVCHVCRYAWEAGAELIVCALYRVFRVCPRERGYLYTESGDGFHPVVKLYMAFHHGTDSHIAGHGETAVLGARGKR